MSGETPLRVVADDLRGRATAIDAEPWPDNDAHSNPSAPCELQLAVDATNHLRWNYLGLIVYSEAGKAESKRLTETLINVADAYTELDGTAGHSFTGGPPPAPVPVKPCSTPAPPHPGQITDPPAVDPGSGNVVETQQQLLAGDQGQSLTALAGSFAARAAKLDAKAQAFNVAGLNWEGNAAEAADTRFGAMASWIEDLATTWGVLAGQAQRIATAHGVAVAAHTPVHTEYVQLMEQAFQLWSSGQLTPEKKTAIEERLKELNEESEAIRKLYAQNATITAASPSDIPSGAIDPTSVSAIERPRTGPDVPANAPAAPDGGPGNSASAPSPSPSPPPTPNTTPVSNPAGTPKAAQPTGASQGTGSGSPSGGGAPSGGSPAGGGAPSGGGLPSRPPGGGRDMPKLPNDPSIRRAAASGGGAGGGSGGGGGGAPSMPLQPNVGGVSVGPAPAAGGAGAGAGPTAASPGGGGMGGMGAMPMDGAGHGQGGEKEKKRAPGLAPDEDIYTEDRPWTEAVIGNRRRRDVQDNKESK